MRTYLITTGPDQENHHYVVTFGLCFQYEISSLHVLSAAVEQQDLLATYLDPLRHTIWAYHLFDPREAHFQSVRRQCMVQRNKR